MSIWSDMQERGVGDLIKNEDIHKASLLIKRIGNAEKLSGFYTKDEILFKLNHQQQLSIRWHRCDLVLDDERFKRRALFRFGVLSPLGNTGESVVQDAIDKVEKEYGYFDGYTCDEEKADMHKYVSEKTRKMIDEIRDILDRHGMVLLGWRYLIRYRRAISAELVQDLYYDSPEGEGLRVLRPYGSIKEKEIGLYKVTFEWFKKEQNEEIVLRTQDDNIYAAIGTDVVSTWQKVNDECVRGNGNWSFYVKPQGVPLGEASFYYDEHDDQQKKRFLETKMAYLNTLCKEHGCKIGEFEDEKLREKYWDAFTIYLNQKSIDTLKTNDNHRKVFIFWEGIDDIYYCCRINPDSKNPTNFIVIAIRIYNIKHFDFIEEKFKTQIESLQCQEVRWRRGGVRDEREYISVIDIMLEANFRIKSDWPRQMEWLYNTVMELHKIIKPYYSEISKIR